MRCPHCRHCESVVVPALQMLEARVRALEQGVAVRVAAGPQDRVEQTERQMIIDALRVCGGIQSHAAQLLGMTARRMHYRIQKYGLQHLCPLRVVERKRPMKRLALTLLCLLLAAPVCAQAVLNPTKIAWQVSANHSDTLPDGSSMVLRYEVRFYAPTATAPTSTSNLGKPTPNASNIAEVDLTTHLVALPIDPSIQFVARIVALGPTGTSDESPSSNPFVKAGKPGAPANVVVSR